MRAALAHSLVEAENDDLLTTGEAAALRHVVRDPERTLVLARRNLHKMLAASAPGGREGVA